MLGQAFSNPPSEEDARRWLETELNRVFPRAESLIREMKLEVRFKGVTYETLDQKGFLESVKVAFPGSADWDKAYDEFKAAGESDFQGNYKDSSLILSPEIAAPARLPNTKNLLLIGGYPKGGVASKDHRRVYVTRPLNAGQLSHALG